MSSARVPCSGKLVFATRNKHKIRELQELIAPLGFEAVPLLELAPNAPDVQETGATFLENAMLKAEAAYRLTGLPSVADDSGICIDYLDGAPGIYSARWAGDDESNNDRLLVELEGVPDDRRGAHYVCAIAMVAAADTLAPNAPAPAERRDDTVRVHAIGRLYGRIGYERVGAGGFGYDPLFIVPDTNGQTVAQLPTPAKHAISHRGHAFRELTDFLKKYRRQG